MYQLKYIGIFLSPKQQLKTTMADLKKNQLVNASTIRGETIAGKIIEITPTLKGNWYKIKPDDKDLAEFQTRAAKITPR